MSVDNSPKLLLSQQFKSFEELAAMVIAWDFDFHQLSKNYSVTALKQIQTGNILFSHLSCGCFSTHTGSTPENMCTIGLPDAHCPAFRYFDHHIDRPVLLVTTPGQDFDLIARPGYGMSTFSIPQPVLEQFIESGSDASANRLQGFEDGIIPVNPEMVAGLRAMVRQLLSFAPHLQVSPDQFDAAQLLETQLLACLARSIQQEEHTKNVPGVETRNRILKHAREFAREHEHDRLNVRDLAAAANTSERTLERVFNREFGISPKRYLLGERMYGAHRQLWQASPYEASVTDIANAWGFWHMGQFAKDYRGMFGELPSETLNRLGATRFN